LILKVRKSFKVDHDLQKIDWQTNYWKHSLHLNLKKKHFIFLRFFFHHGIFLFHISTSAFFLTKLDCYTNKNNHFVLKKQGDVFNSIQNPRGSHQAWSHFFLLGTKLGCKLVQAMMAWARKPPQLNLNLDWNWKFWNLFSKKRLPAPKTEGSTAVEKVGTDSTKQEKTVTFLIFET